MVSKLSMVICQATAGRAISRNEGVPMSNHKYRQILEKLQDDIAASYGFMMETHKMELYGQCAKCRK